jgi:hypothetical protein
VVEVALQHAHREVYLAAYLAARFLQFDLFSLSGLVLVKEKALLAVELLLLKNRLQPVA